VPRPSIQGAASTKARQSAVSERFAGLHLRLAA